jgi:pyroglutamyl-peptidase
MRLLITSFGPFANFKVNPSNEVMSLLTRGLMSEEMRHQIDYETLEVSYDEVDLFIKKIEKKSYDYIVHLGVATHDAILRLETRARNERSGADVLGIAPVTREINAKSANLTTNCSLDMIQKFTKNHPGKVRVSDDAGTFLCNYIYYNSLQVYGTRSKVLFIHIADYVNNPDAIHAAEQAEIVRSFIRELID